jgi:hypothetical protein
VKVDLLRAGWSPAPERLPGLVDWVDRVHNGIVATTGTTPSAVLTAVTAFVLIAAAYRASRVPAAVV